MRELCDIQADIDLIWRVLRKLTAAEIEAVQDHIDRQAVHGLPVTKSSMYLNAILLFWEKLVEIDKFKQENYAETEDRRVLEARRKIEAKRKARK